MRNAVSDGMGLAVSVGARVSVKVGVSVSARVDVAEGTGGVTVSVIGENAVSVETAFAVTVGAIGVEVNWQARDGTIHKKESSRFRLMG